MKSNDPIRTAENESREEIACVVPDAGCTSETVSTLAQTPTPEPAEIDGEALDAMLSDWKGQVYAEFPEVQTVDALNANTETRTTTFVSIAALVKQRKVVVVWVAEAREIAPCGTKPKSISVTAKTLPEPTDPEALPEPFRGLALKAFAQS